MTLEDQILDSINELNDLRDLMQGSDNPLDREAYEIAGQHIEELKRQLRKLGGIHAAHQI